MKKYIIYTLLLCIMIAGQTVLSFGQQKSTSYENIITVGQRKADIIGTDNRAIQAAIDMVALRGGGTVHILSGTYILEDAIHLQSNVHLTGDGQDKTILKHAPSIASLLLKDADLGQKEATPKDPSLFKVGMGIVIRSNKYQNEMSTRPSTITRIENGVPYFNNYLDWDFTADYDGPEKVVGGAV